MFVYVQSQSSPRVRVSSRYDMGYQLAKVRKSLQLTKDLCIKLHTFGVFEQKWMFFSPVGKNFFSGRGEKSLP